MVDKNNQRPVEKGGFTRFLPIIIYYFLPKAEITTFSKGLNIFFEIGQIIRPVGTVVLIYIIFQQRKNKLTTINVKNWTITLYILYFFTIIFGLMLLELIN